ncbi:MAG: hypothetical protein JJ992_29205, partial [Planctomycetes bacterium]|nr:hypothetical protein [Planctomycetota bacterium]
PFTEDDDVIEGFPAYTSKKPFGDGVHERGLSPESGAFDLAGGDDQLLAEEGILGRQLLAGPSQVHGKTGYERQRARGLADARLDATHDGRDSGSKPGGQDR